MLQIRISREEFGFLHVLYAQDRSALAGLAFLFDMLVALGLLSLSIFASRMSSI